MSDSFFGGRLIHASELHYNQTTELMNAPIYKLNKAIIERFQIQALPSVVKGQDDTILVREIDARVLN